ncbi:MAG TPA: hypothetical protein VOA87_19055, partial [Thermoanaerobaculia bacterium]|nr:hypothetical protein [Thermoanaerobaculia bacterium]
MPQSQPNPAPRTVLAFLFVLLSAALPAAAAVPAETDELEAFLRVTAVVGREEPAAAFVASRLAGLPSVRDALGNVVLTFGSGEPRRLVACPLGEPGFAVTAIQEDGYLRLSPIGGAPADALWEQAHEGQVVTIGGARGLVPGAVAVHSVHLHREIGGFPDHPFTAAEAYVDVGAESAGEVAELGIRLLDPVALVR